MRDLHATGAQAAANGDGARLDLEEDDGAPQRVTPAPERESYRAVRRDQKLAEIAVMLLDAARILEPVVELLCNRALRWALLACDVGLAFYAVRFPSWERLYIVVAFMVLSPLVLLAGGKRR